MLQQEPPASRRRSVRRAVHVETQVLSDIWDDEIALLATDLSPDGVWLQTPLPLDPGDEVVVALRPPRWEHAQPLLALASVARVGLPRRRGDALAAGMGLRFVDLGRPGQRALARALRGLPPPLPGHPQAERPRTPARRPEPVLALSDGTEVVFEAAGGLLTGGRRSVPPEFCVTADNVIPLRPARRLFAI